MPGNYYSKRYGRRGRDYDDNPKSNVIEGGCGSALLAGHRLGERACCYPAPQFSFIQPNQRVVRDSEVDALFHSLEGRPYAYLQQLKGAVLYWSKPLSSEHMAGPGPMASFISFLRVQADPFAPGSHVTVTMPLQPLFEATGTTLRCLLGGSTARRIGLEDYLLRRLVKEVYSAHPRRYCSNNNARHHIDVLRPSQNVVERTALRFVFEAPEEEFLQLRACSKLPGNGRRIDGRGCLAICQALVGACQALFVPEEGSVTGEFELPPGSSPPLAPAGAKLIGQWRQIADIMEDQEWLRAELQSRRLVAFVRDGAVLPRAGGNCDAPMRGLTAGVKGLQALPEGTPIIVPFQSPPQLSVSFTLPRTGLVLTGMGLPEGITVITGGGFHGKSTLLRALEVGIYNKAVGDGREFVVARHDSVKIRAEDRRSICSVDISPFINNIPFRASTRHFTTKDASGSTSQGANIMEALEVGARVLLIDEDTSATNFMMQDETMRALIGRDNEPITTFIERARQLFTKHRVSTVAVVGGCGAYLSIADVVLTLDKYKAFDVTHKARTLLQPREDLRGPDDLNIFASALSTPRLIDIAASFRSLDAERSRCSGQGMHIIRVGDNPINSRVRPRSSTKRERRADNDASNAADGEDEPEDSRDEHIRNSNDENIVDVSAVEQLVEPGQLNGIALAFVWLWKNKRLDQLATVSTCVDDALAKMQQPGISCHTDSMGNASFMAVGKDLDAIIGFPYYSPPGFVSFPRRFELAAALNRLRTLMVKYIAN